MKLKSKPLYSQIINEFIKNNLKHKCFIGTFPSDKLPKLNKRPITLIGNTHTSKQPGEHWVAILLFKNGTGEYFDSFGLPPINREYRQYMESMCEKGWKYNSKCIQNPSLNSVTCGHYCITYLLLRCRGYSFCQILCNFNRDLQSNDNKVVKMINKLKKFCGENVFSVKN